MKRSKLTFFTFIVIHFSFFLNAQQPNWTVNSANFSLDASIIAELKIDKIFSTDTNDIVAIFDEDNIIRGVAKVFFVSTLNKHLIFLTINGNTGGDILSFKVYDASDDVVLDVPDTLIEFIPNKITGSADNAFLITAINSFLPTTKTYSATNVTVDSATLKGEILSKGKSNELIEYGFLLSSEDSYPKINEPNISKITLGNSIGSFTHTTNQINTGSNIHFYRTYATNSYGTSYGDVKRFSLNNSLNFDGIDDFISITDNSAFNFSNGFSVDVLVYPTSFNKKSTIISQYTNTQKAFSIALNTGGVVIANFSVDGTSETSLKSNLRLALNKWQHLTVTFNNGVIKIFINGLEDTASSIINPLNGFVFDSSYPILIGAKNNTDFFKGKIDELRIWGKPIEINIINTIKNNVVPTHINGLIGYYNFNQGISQGNNSSINQLLDKTDNNLHGTITSFSRSGNSSNFVNGVYGSFNNNQIAQNIFISSGNWSNPNNWSFGSVPKKIDRAIVKENQEINIDVVNLEIDDLILENNATLKIPKDKAIIINNQLNSNGTLELGSDTNDSGVLLVNGKTTGTVTYKRGGLLANKWSIVTPPVSGQTVKSFAENADNNIRVNTTPDPDRYAIAYYDDSQVSGSKWRYYDANVNATDEFTAGQSYSISRATDGQVSFTGTLTVDDMQKTLNAGQWNAIGNPFTTYYPANKNSSNSFLSDNISVLDDTYPSIYVWDNDQEKYIAVTNIDETARSLPPGQGFFIKMKEGENEISFSKNKRSTKPASGNNDFAKTNNTVPSLTLNLSNGKHTVNTAIKYFENTTVGFDKGYDIGNFNSAGLDIYTHLVNQESTTNFTIQSLPKDNYENMIVPIGIKAKKEEEITLSVNTLNLPNQIEVYLEDKLQNQFTKLTEDFGKTFKTVLENDVNGIGRFYIHTSRKTLNANDINAFSNVSIYTIHKKLIIKGLDKTEASVKIYSLLGKQILQTKLKQQKSNEIALTNIASGIYLVQVQTENSKLNKKVIVE